MVMHPSDAARLRDYDRMSAELARVKAEGLPGVMHEVDRSFYNLAIQERDYARIQVGNRDQELGEMRATIQRLKAELDAAGRRSVLLCPAGAILEAMDVSKNEPEGTIIRATDDPELEYELKGGSWVPRR